MQKTVAFMTLGCKVNQYDTQAMLELFTQRGYGIVSDHEMADIYVINTCTVTDTGDKKSLKLCRRYQRKNPEADIILTGCLAQRLASSLLPTGARLILGTQRRAEVVDLLEKAVAENVQLVAVTSLESTPFEPLHISKHEGHTRAVMKIQEGCNNQCTFCIIPSVRGGIRSRSLEDIHQEALTLAQTGFVEIVLTGIHLTSYGRDLPGKPSLIEAIQAVASVEGIVRIRLGSLEPVVVTETFAQELAQISKVCAQFHLSLQSGSDSVLVRMKRRYRSAQFAKAVTTLRKYYPHGAFTTDVIVGFPGETTEEFADSLNFMREIGFAQVHIFPYSQREGTAAATMEGQVNSTIKHERVQETMELARNMSQQYREAQIGTFATVLLEEQQVNGTWTGYTDTYIPVVVDEGRAGENVLVQLDAMTPTGMHGVIY